MNLRHGNMRMTHRSILALAFGLLISLPPAASGQAILEMDVRGTELTRQELTHLLERLEEAASAPGYSRELRSQAAREAAYVRDRLQNGDFRVGDRVVLTVAGEPQLSDTFTVTGNQTLDLPQIGPIPLDGVLRSELESHLRDALGEYLRDPDIRAHALIRIAVLGAVGSPGFYTLPASALLEEALMAAGGPGAGSDIDNLHVRRGESIVWEGDLLQRAMVEGRTLDQLSLRAGDRIVMPQRRPGLFEGGVVRTLLVTLPPLLYLLFRVL